MLAKQRLLWAGLTACLLALIPVGFGSAQVQAEYPAIPLTGWAGPGSDARIGMTVPVQYQVRPEPKVTDLIISLKLPSQLRLMKVTINGKPVSFIAEADLFTWRLVGPKTKRPLIRNVVIMSLQLKRKCPNGGACVTNMVNRFKTRGSNIWQEQMSPYQFIVRK
ncbi:hypothetical protein H0X09_03305 [Candidatus Saccharibacteria bacterium]|nr:hypothetical protein [Candidatus Saccharibacteria bacterium]